MTGDVTYTAQFNTVGQRYTVTWKNWNGSILETDKDVAYGATPTYNGTTPTKPSDAQYSYTFAGWDKAITAVTEDITYTALFNTVGQRYTVTWKNWDGTTLVVDRNIAYGATPKYDGATPTKPADEQYSYTFAGWDKVITAVTGDVTYIAQFNTVGQKYTVTWKNWNGSILETDENVAYGTIPSYDGTTPTKASDTQYRYVFAGWDKVITAVTGDVTYIAQFNTVGQKYTVTWKNWNGSILETDEDVAYGATPTYNGPTPTKPSDAQYSYTFAGWDKEITAVTGDVTYIAQFNTVGQKYTVTWKNWDGTTLVVDRNIAYGTTPTYDGATPTKPSDAQYSYTFAGWDKAITAVTGDATYTAVFTRTVKQYKVTFDANGHGSSPAAITVSVGQKITKPADPSASSYTFGGWYKEASCTNEWRFDTDLMPSKDITLYAKWTYSGSTTGGGGSSSGGSGGGGGSSSGGSGGGGGSSSGGSGGGGSAGGPGAKSTAVAGAPTFSKNWVADAAGVWRIRDKGGNYVTSAWLCDDAVTTNGQNVWYLMNTDGTMLAAGLVQDNTGNYYSLEMNHNGYYGMLRYVNGTYDGIYMEFSQKHDGTFGAITNQSAIDALKAKYGVTRFGIGNDRCVYTKSFE